MKKNNATEYLHVWRRRALGALSALLIAASAVALTAATAAADMRCNYDGVSFNACLTVEDRGWGTCRLLVGIDVYMSLPEAQFLLVLHGGRPFVVQLLAHDHPNPIDDTSGLGEFDDRSTWSVSAGVDNMGRTGLFGSFDMDVDCDILDEDRGEEKDELVARVELLGGSFFPPRTYHSGIVEGHYE